MNEIQELDWNIFFTTDVQELIAYENKIFNEFSYLPLQQYIEKRCEFLSSILYQYQNNQIDIVKSNIEFLINYVQNKQYKIGIYAGSFSPFHVGHLDILKQAMQDYDKVIICRGINGSKYNNASKLEEFPESIKQNYEIIGYSGLLAEFVLYFPYKVDIIRGIRNKMDFDEESQLHTWCKEINPSVSFRYYFANKEFEHISSSSIKEIEKYSNQYTEKYRIK